jgi:UDP-3-O-[3-hydroxymyristoyl] glucosamine N-acyltransferase
MREIFGLMFQCGIECLALSAKDRYYQKDIVVLHDVIPLASRQMSEPEPIRAVLNHLRTKYAGLDLSESEAEQVETVTRTGFVWSSLPGTLALAVNRKYLAMAATNPHVVAVVIPEGLDSSGWSRGVIRCNQAAELFYALHNAELHRNTKLDSTSHEKPQIDPSAVIHSSAIIESGVKIEKNVEVRAGAIISSGTKIGPNSIIEERVTIGSEGLFAKNLFGRRTHVRHFGGVTIGADCFIHAGTNIARSVNCGESTLIGDQVHIGVLSIIGHDCIIGSNTVISSGAIIAGRAKIGTDCWIGAGANISNAVTVGNKADIKIGATVIDDLEEGAEVLGNFAIPHPRNIKTWLRNKNGQIRIYGFAR